MMSNVQLTKTEASSLIKKQLRAGWSVEDYGYGRITLQNMEFGYVGGMKEIRFGDCYWNGAPGTRVKSYRKGARWMKATAANVLKAAQEVVERCNKLTEQSRKTA